jgi:hypothetical protein
MLFVQSLSYRRGGRKPVQINRFRIMGEVVYKRVSAAGRAIGMSSDIVHRGMYRLQRLLNNGDEMLTQLSQIDFAADVRAK